MKLAAHCRLQRSESLVACAMTGVELCMGIAFQESLGQRSEFVHRLVVIEQMESAHNRMNGIGTRRKNILQATVGAAREEQAVCV